MGRPAAVVIRGLAALALFAPLLAGCLGGTPGGSSAPAALERGLLLNDCEGIKAFANYPGQTAPGARPDGWPAASGQRAATQVGVLALRCQRVSLGPFERGPMHLAFDWHTNAQAPASCGGPSGSLVLGSLWTDDGDLAAYLAARHAAPALRLAFAEDATTLPEGRRHEWSWGPAGGESTLAVLSDGVFPQTTSGSFQAHWPAGAGVGRLQLDWTAGNPMGDRPAQGSMRPPMLAGDFTGPGQWLDGYEASGSLALFADSDCLEAVA